VIRRMITMGRGKTKGQEGQKGGVVVGGCWWTACCCCASCFLLLHGVLSCCFPFFSFFGFSPFPISLWLLLLLLFVDSCGFPLYHEVLCSKRTLELLHCFLMVTYLVSIPPDDLGTWRRVLSTGMMEHCRLVVFFLLSNCWALTFFHLPPYSHTSSAL
jgi:hypothetical protein